MQMMQLVRRSLLRVSPGRAFEELGVAIERISVDKSWDGGESIVALDDVSGCP